jgi:hypothetical protein
MIVTRQTAWLILFSFGSLLAFALANPAFREGNTDFLSFYAGARLVETPESLYSAEHADAIQRTITPLGGVRPFIRPPYFAALLWPLGRLSYSYAHLLWQLLNLAALAAFVLLWSPRPLSVLLCCWYLPTWLSFLSAQDMPLVLLATALAGFLLRSGRHLSAGLVLSLCGVKFHLFLLLPLLIVARRLWRTAAGLAVGAAFLFTASCLVAGWDWPVRYVHLLRLNETMQDSHSYMPTLLGLFHRLPVPLAAVLPSAAVVVAATWLVLRRSNLPFSFAFVLLAALLLSPHAFVYDLMILLPLYFSLAEQGSSRAAALLQAGVSLSALTLGVSSLSWIGKLAVLSLFLWTGFSALRKSAPQPGPQEGVPIR